MSMWIKTFAGFLAFVTLLPALPLSSQAAPAGPSLEQGFSSPPDSTKPWCYWYWISDHISREGITRDLEAMARVGIGEAFVGNIFLDDVPAGRVKVLSEEWWGLVEHAIREGGRVGVNIGMFNCPGWSQSGGPWIKPEQSMRHLVSSETRVQGPASFHQKLPVPREPFQDVALLAFRAPREDADSLGRHAPRLTCTPAVECADKLVDGKLDTALTFPAGAGQGRKPFTIDIELTESLVARSLSLVPSEAAWSGQVELLAQGPDSRFHQVRTFKFDRSNMAIGVGPMPRGPVTVAFAPTRASRFRLSFTGVGGKAALAEINLSAAARVESFVEKQLGKMHPTPLPMWDTYLWPGQPELDEAALTVAPEASINLTGRLAPDSTLRWEVPAGDWIILRTGMTPTGTRNAPASPEGQGLEVDKMNRAAARFHFDAFIGQLLKRMPAAERRAFTRVVADSYEMGSQNWTDGFARTFQRRYGYDPAPWLPTLTGRVVGSAGQSDRFLWDLRRLVADHVATDYVGGLRDLCRPHGLQLWLENYGHWGFPAEFLQYGGQSDRIGGEFWVTGDLGSIECRAASSAANTYGKPVVSSEAFTGGPAFQTAPRGLKARGDWAFCEGINHFVLHVYILQPWEDRRPGVNAWFGTEFNRHNTWFDASRAWVDYLRRCCFLLQQGTRVADVAYFIGEDTPKMTGLRQPELPPGRDFDYINAEVIQEKLRVKDGLLTLPHGTTYRLLVLPELATMRPAVARKIRELVREGATVLGPPPSRSPSLEDYPQCDATVGRIAAELWGEGERGPSGERKIGKGRVIWGKSLDQVFGAAEFPPDFSSLTRLRHTHRVAGDAHIYFVANPQPDAVATKASFRVTGLAPELWWPETGRCERPAVYDEAAGTTRLPLHLGPHESVFVVFRQPATAGHRLVSVTRDGKAVLDTVWPATPAAAESAAGATNNFTLAFWVKPADDTLLLPETNQGVHGLSSPRNDVVFPPHGVTFGDGARAGAGLAVGRNGVCVFEHGANYFAPVLVHAAPLSDWTYLAMVYRDGQASLYLNGRLARTGLKSSFTVHPPPAQAGGSYRGELGTLELVGRALSADEIAQRMTSTPRPADRLPAGGLNLTGRDDGKLQGRFMQPGDYTIKAADGRSRSLTVTAVPEPFGLAGPWEVQFAADSGAPAQVTFEQLEDWTRRPEESIKHYSGKAIYRKTFELPDVQKGKSYTLDLGKVRDLAIIRLNGQDLGTLWLAPWRVDITRALRPGVNRLELEVINPWNNRLVGDAKLPAGQRRTYLAAQTVPATTPLLPAGLLGPVKIETAQTLELPWP